MTDRPMTAFLVLATALVLLALAVLLRSVLGSRGDPAMARALRTENIAIAREQLAALDAARRSDDLADSDYAEERSRIEAMLSRELEHGGNVRESRTANLALGAVIALGVPLGAAWLYAQIGTPAAIATSPAASVAANTDAGPDAGPPALAELVPRLEQRLSEQPDDVMGWRLLGRTYIGMERFDLALRPLARALELEPDDAGTHTQLAEARAMLAGGDLGGLALESLERAYALDPRHEQTLWLLGVARQQAGRHADAIALLGTLRDIADAAGNVQAITTIDEYLGVSRAALGESDAAVPGGDADDGEAGTVPAALVIEISLGGAAATVDPSLAVFVYARAVDGPPMPLAVQRLSVADLPMTVTLDESMAMLPNMTLAAFPEVVVGARVSLTGQPVPSSGDWSVESTATVGRNGTAEAPLTLTIDRQLP